MRLFGIASAALVLVCAGPSAAQVGPLPIPRMECAIDRVVQPLAPDMQVLGSIFMFSRGFSLDWASGVFRWRSLGGELGNPERWRVVQQGARNMDWVAIRSPADEGYSQIIRVRPWGQAPGRFVIFNDIGTIIVGTCDNG